MLAVAARGAHIGGRSVVYQTAVTGFGLHALTHLAQSAVVRGYTPGVATVPLVAAPFSVWARRRLRQAGVPVTRRGVMPLGWVRALGAGRVGPLASSRLGMVPARIHHNAT